MSINISVSMYTYISIYICMYAYVYILTYTHTYTYLHTSHIYMLWADHLISSAIFLTELSCELIQLTYGKHVVITVPNS